MGSHYRDRNMVVTNITLALLLHSLLSYARAAPLDAFSQLLHPGAPNPHPHHPGAPHPHHSGAPHPQNPGAPHPQIPDVPLPRNPPPWQHYPVPPNIIDAASRQGYQGSPIPVGTVPGQTVHAPKHQVYPGSLTSVYAMSRQDYARSPSALYRAPSPTIVYATPRRDYMDLIPTPGFVALNMMNMGRSVVSDLAYNLSKAMLFMLWL